MSVNASTGSKWTCQVCTFDNHMSAVRCAMCYTNIEKAKESHGSAGCTQQSTLLITQYDNNSKNAHQSNEYQRGSDQIWSCASCTYENCLNSSNCSMCGWVYTRAVRKNATKGHTNRKNESIQQESNNSNNSNSNIKPMAQMGPVSPGATKRVPSQSIYSDIRTREEMQFYNDKNNERNHSNNPTSHGDSTSTNVDTGTNVINYKYCNKWICSRCTYENFIKSLRCVMCQNPRYPQEAQIDLNQLNSSQNNTSSNSDQYITSTSVKSKSPSVNQLTNHACNRGKPESCYITYSPTEEMIDNPYDTEVKIDNLHSYDAFPITEEDLNQIKNHLSTEDWSWLGACQGVKTGKRRPVEQYIASGGDVSRQLTNEDLMLLKWTNPVEIGYTLVHLAIKYDHQDLLDILLTPVADRRAHKCLPSDAEPELAQDIREIVSMSIRQRKGEWPCYFVTNIVTFALPAGIHGLSPDVQEQLFNEIIDRDVQNELEVNSTVINWSYEITEDLDSKLYTLWNRTAGDCLLDSVMQVTWGVMDENAVLRRALRESLRCEDRFYQRWREAEAIQASILEFSLDEQQCVKDWSNIIDSARKKGAPLEQIHIFVLAHIMRRPIIVYGVKYVNSYKGETLGLARFQGIYLPLLWERSFCVSNPVALAYTRGHFSAVVGIESDTVNDAVAGANVDNCENTQTIYLPLIDSLSVPLPVHFLLNSELGCEEQLMHEWLDCECTSSGIIVAKQNITRMPFQVDRMLDNWLDKYRKLDS
ncbi:Ubiquitin thioesterase zranb1-B [Trichoplax sp. H2]|nr:Ubiquitin thioesterase zranb1-B [Trichoplax sp. H2]|eukprot:RDD41971.1 Ubiquitin thioesterase zranb1-B [Trichoplax sp. H2]